MVLYDDSDDSAGEELDFTETNVLLGYASRDEEDNNISKLGGRPEWLDASAPPSASLARCKACKDLMVLLLQLNAELPDRFPGHERRLYVFSCQRKTCRRSAGSTRVLRALRVAPGTKAVPAPVKRVPEPESKPPPADQAKMPAANLGETLFASKGLGSKSGPANPFAVNASSSGNPFSLTANTLSGESSRPNPTIPTPSETNTTKNVMDTLPKTFAETLSLNKPVSKTDPPPPAETWPGEENLPAPYPVSYLAEADFETLEPTPLPIAQATERMDLDESSSSTSGGKEDREVFESSMDADFQKFADRLAQNPDQCIRYEFGGQPLLYSKKDAIGQAFGAGRGMPRCGNCGKARTFEVQMTPNAIAELEADDAGLDGMDWGTIIVGVCEADCQAPGVGEGNAGYLEEWAGVQWEELSARK